MRMYLISILLGLMTAIIASNKGYGFLRWWFRGTVFAPFALLYAIFMKKNTDSPQRNQSAKNLIQCPNCKERVEMDAERCRFCHKKMEIIDI